MSRTALTPPALEPYGWRYDLMPGPLSPAWPQPVKAAPPEDEFLALAAELEAMRRAAVWSLAPRLGTGPFYLSLDERARLNAVCVTLRAENAALPHNVRVPAATRWPLPVLPDGALFGARDIVRVLDTAISVARAASAARRKWSWA